MDPQNSSIIETGHAMQAGDGSWLGWVIAGISAVVTGLTSSVAFLYRSQVKLYEDRIKYLETHSVEVAKVIEKAHIEHLKCKDDHAQTQIELARMNERVAMLECGKQDK